MTATGINVAAQGSATCSFVSVTVKQVSYTGGQSIKGSFMSRLENASAGLDGQMNDKIAASTTPNKTEYSKEQVKANANEEPKTAYAPTDGTYEASKKQVTDGDDVNTDSALKVVDAGTGTAKAAETEGTAVPMEDIDEKDMMNALEILGTLIAQIADILQTTVEELQTKIDELQLIPQDMTDNNALARLVLSMNGSTDLSDMLVDNDMLKAFEEIRNLVSEVLEQFSTTADEFAKITETPQFAEMLETKGLTFEKDGEVIRLRPENEEVSDIPEQENEPEFKVEVEKKGFKEDNSNGSPESEEKDDDSIRLETSSKAAKSTRREDEHFTTAAESFVKGLENVMKPEDVKIPGLEGQITVRDIVYQLVEEVKVQITPDNTSLEMSLNPESLGKVNLNITSKDGVMTAQITTQNEVSKEALESQLQILKENIEAQGVRVEAIEVTVAAYTFSDSKNAESDGQNEANEGGRRRSKGISDVGSDMAAAESEAERIRQEMMEQTGSTVTYVA